MNKGSITKFLKGQTAHRAPKFAALAVSCCVLVAMVAIDASASPKAKAHSHSHSSVHARSSAHSLLSDWQSVMSQVVEIELGRKYGRPVVATPTTSAVTSSTVTSSGAAGASGGGAVTTAPAPTTTTTAAPTTTTTAAPTTTTAAPTTTTTAPATPSASGGLISAGPSRSECLVPNHPSDTLAGIQSSINTFQSATNSTVTCLGVYTDSSQSWTDWSDPWIVGPSGAPYASWVAAAPQSRQLVVEVDLIPVSLQDVSNPLSWETSCAAGAFNSYAAELGTNLVKAGLENSVIRLGSEMNGTWEGDFVGTTTQEQNLWATCFDNEVTALRQASGEHFLIDWNPNACTQNIPYANYYPGNAYVNIMGLDLYDVDCAAPSTAASFSKLSSEVAGLSSFESFAAANGKPMSFPEWGLTSSPGGDDPAYVNGIGSTVNNGNFAFQEYFDVVNGASLPIDTGSTPLAAAAYQKSFG
jgi:hypothetical protein